MYWEQAWRGLMRHGVDAWWCDCTEPFEADWKGNVRLGPEERMAINTEMTAEYLDPGQGQAYSLMHSRGIWEGQRAAGSDAAGSDAVGSDAAVGEAPARPAKRVLNLTRSASLGQQRYGTFTWSGDLSASWNALRAQIPEGLNFCLSGMPYWTNDIGGFFVAAREQWFWKGDFDSGVDDPGYRELFLRWFQYATFLPMMRAHGTDTPREPWRFGEAGDAEGVYDALARFLRLREMLRPYLYSLALAVTLEDGSMLRALVFDFPGDGEAIRIEDQFMLGPSLMVCPVTEALRFGPGGRPVVGGRATRPVYLPGATAWTDFWTGERRGPGWIEASAALDIIPVFLKPGAILPLAPGGWPPCGWPPGGGGGAESGRPASGSLDSCLPDTLDIVVAPGGEGAFRFYEDSGEGYGYERGEYAFTDLTWHDSLARLDVSERKGGYPGMPASRRFVLRIAGPGFSPEGGA